jgi:hypothetical protein
MAEASGISSIPASRNISRDETSSFAFDPQSFRHHFQKYHQLSGFTSSISGGTTSSSGLILTNGTKCSLQEQVDLDAL